MRVSSKKVHKGSNVLTLMEVMRECVSLSIDLDWGWILTKCLEKE
jgi:hypothetical protein